MAKGELEARARLFFTSSGMETASVAVECDATSAWLVWVDGSKTPIDASASLVEGALDAIEDRLAQRKRTPPQTGAPPSPSPPSAPGSGLAPSRDDASAGAGSGIAVGDSPEIQADESSERRALLPKPPPGTDLEGGVGLALLTEFWSGAVSAGMGPRLDVGVGIGRKLAIVVSEGARFAVGSGSGQMMAFDLQAGLAYGAPYQTRTGFGIVALGGAERLAASASSGGTWTWSVTGSLGLRGSVAVGPVDAWIGVDAMLRSSTIETGRPHPSTVPTLSALLSVGCFLPAFARSAQEEGYVAARRQRVIQ